MAQRMKFNKTAFLAMLFTSLILNGFVSKVWSDDEVDSVTGAKSSDFIKTRLYIGGVGISSTIDQWGDFNGTNGFVHSSGVSTNAELDLIPSITRQFGWGALAGYREGPWAAEISFWRSDHTASYISGGVTSTTPASLQAINIDFKRYLFTQLPTQPFISVGLSFPWLWVRNFSYILDPSQTTILQTNDETISGLGFNLGAGLEIYLDNDFSLIGGAYQRWTGFNQINGAIKIGENNLYWDGNPSDTGSIEGDGLNFYVGATFGIE